MLVKDNGKALLWAKNPVTTSRFDSNGNFNVWSKSPVRTTLNGTWLNSTTVLKTKAIETNITTRSAYDASTWITTTDTVFLLSEADVFGTFNGTAASNAQDYTYGNTVIVPDENMRKSTRVCWLRSPRDTQNSVAVVTAAGTVDDYGSSSSSVGVRPALWVDYVN